MHSAFETILRRRSIRRYTSQAVDEETLTLLLQAAMAAPTAANSQPWEFVVITEPERLERLRASLPFGSYEAPAAILVCGNPDAAHNTAGRLHWEQDCSAAIENILIAATGLGLGSVWIGIHPLPAAIKAVREVCHLPEQVRPLGLVYVGHAAEEKPARTQYDARRVFWQEYEPRKRRARLKNAKHL